MDFRRKRVSGGFPTESPCEGENFQNDPPTGSSTGNYKC